MLAMVLSGCVSTGSATTSISTVTQHPLPTLIPPTYTLTPHPAKTATLTPSVTLEPEQAKHFLLSMLREPKCSACFWGISPEKTTLSEAKNTFSGLGIELTHTSTQNNGDFYALIYDFDNGLRVSPVFTIQNDIVKNITVDIIPEKHKAGVPRQWLAYSPEMLIKQYGLPSKVDFILDWGAPSPSYTITIYFNEVDLIVEYHSYDIGGKAKTPQVCPLTDSFDIVRIWFGKDPEHSQLEGVLLEKATSMTMEEFAKLMTGIPDKACVNLKGEMFP